MGSVRASWLALAATVAAVGCGGSPEPLDLSLTSIEPQEVELGSAGQLTVRGTFEPLLVVDVDSGEVRVDERFVVLLDGAALATEFTDVQTLRAELPTDLAAGSYELIVRNPQGQQTRLQDAFTVIDPGCPPRTIDLAGECVAARRVFLSSTESNAGFGDVTGADSACQDLANTAELGGSWLAWIAENGATAPEMRLEQSLVPYVRLDGA
ncbi:MAG: hypothetical protein KJO07_00855, partial [Deltaproteobacteria bacterium]|nr:hypothetical protein [Deltaproteobacteria bacterium]